jgi:RNA polymerase sigma factor (TIGR02999 family)
MPASAAHADSLEQLLHRSSAGDAEAADALFALLYDEFKTRARAVLRLGHRQTLSTTELVNETWLHLRGRPITVETRAHYFNLAARAMRQVLVDRARHRQAEKRGAGVEPLSLSAADGIGGDDPFDVLVLDQAMARLTEADPALAELASLYLFGGMSSADIAELRGVSERTVYRDWRTARMFLMRHVDTPE